MDSKLLPSDVKNCTINFAEQTVNRVGEQPGLLVKIQRLNVPCSSGGFLQFNRTVKMCGKLEEFPHNRRTLYFHSFANTTLSVYNQPRFHIIYKLVDHCYNVSFLARNGTFVIQPTHLALKCHFKIHLPFGNQIKLHLSLTDAGISNGTSVQNIIYEDIKKSEGRFNYNNLNFDDFSPPSDVTMSRSETHCVGVLVELMNHSNEKWSQCINKADNRIRYSLTSTDNVLLIRISKPQQVGAVSMNPVISLEYSAIPIESIVSQCAFGWILVGQFCMSTFNKRLSWQKAEEFCNDLGGHLPTIQRYLH